jgi:hypothetical protein
MGQRRVRAGCHADDASLFQLLQGCTRLARRQGFKRGLHCCTVLLLQCDADSSGKGRKQSLDWIRKIPYLCNQRRRQLCVL